MKARWGGNMIQYNLMNIINISDNKSEVGGKRKHMLSRFERTTSSSTSSSRIWWQSSNKRILEAIFTGRRLFASLSGDFQVFFAPRSTFFCRIFDINKDGFIDKREFRWMTSSTVISPQVIQTVFQVLNFMFEIWCCQTVNISFRDATRTRTENLISKSSKRWLQGSCKIGEKKSQHLERQKLVEKVLLKKNKKNTERYKERKQLTLAAAEAERRMRNAGIFVKNWILQT